MNSCTLSLTEAPAGRNKGPLPNLTLSARPPPHTLTGGRGAPHTREQQPAAGRALPGRAAIPGDPAGQCSSHSPPPTNQPTNQPPHHPPAVHAGTCSPRPTPRPATYFSPDYSSRGAPRPARPGAPLAGAAHKIFHGTCALAAGPGAAHGREHAPRPGTAGQPPPLPFPSLSAGIAIGGGKRRVPAPRLRDRDREPTSPASPPTRVRPRSPVGSRTRSPIRALQRNGECPPSEDERLASRTQRGTTAAPEAGGTRGCSPAQPQQRLCCLWASPPPSPPEEPAGAGAAIWEGRHPSLPRQPRVSAAALGPSLSSVLNGPPRPLIRQNKMVN
ncbi:proline-rich protein 2-like [Lathamus discolor]|uniref:proline-rich protein 2-like n=1 Tax=Lathamus discolor TaxID=678569 RepID=UPI0032B799AA